MAERANLYPRGNVLWAWWYDEQGERQRRSTGCRVGEEEQARAVLGAVLRKVEAKRRALAGAGLTDGVLTVAAYRRRWIKDRKDRWVASAKDDDGRLEHAMPALGHLPLTQVRAVQVRDLVRSLKARIGEEKADLSPRQVRHVYFTLRLMFADAVAEEILPGNPCALKKGELPAKRDKVAGWRHTAKFKRRELETLISSDRIPEVRRVTYAVLLLTGLRIGEVAARRWRDYDQETEPLGRLLVASSFNRKRKATKAPKNGQAREMPVHPTLASILAAWKLGGWERTYGRPPKEEDLLFIAARGGELKDCTVRDQMVVDLDVLGLPQLRTHDTRRTFISLCQDDGALKDTLRTVTHGAKGDVFDSYTTLSWAAKCAEVSKLKVTLLEGRLLPLQRASGGELSQAVTGAANGSETGDQMNAQGGTRRRTAYLDSIPSVRGLVSLPRGSGSGPALSIGLRPTRCDSRDSDGRTGVATLIQLAGATLGAAS